MGNPKAVLTADRKAALRVAVQEMSAYDPHGTEARAIARRAAAAAGVDWRVQCDDQFIEKNYLSDAAFSGDLATVVQAFSSGHDWDINDRTCYGNQHATILMAAVRNCQNEVVAWLLAHGADPDAGYGYGTVSHCPLHETASAGATTADAFLRCKTMLLEAGADVNARQGLWEADHLNCWDDGLTPLQCAAKSGNMRYIHLLLTWGADIHALSGVSHLSVLELAATPQFVQSMEASDPYFYAASSSRYQASRTLLEDVLRAGSWKSYALAPRKELLALRVLCEHGRARTAHPILGRLFPWSPPPSDKRAPKRRLRAMDGGPVPKEIFWHIIGYWRSERELISLLPRIAPPVPRGPWP